MENKITSSLLEAINVLSKANDANNIQTITVEAVIESVDNVVLGKYTVNYMENKFTAYASGGTSYQKEQKVYVLIPNGDFTKSKMIIGAVGGNALSQIQEDNSRYIFTSDNIIFNGNTTHSLCSYQNKTEEWNALSEDNKILFYKYVQKQKVFQFSCDIKTSLPVQQIDKRGYYYLNFTYAIIQDGFSVHQTITLNVNNILGNPYQLNDWVNQKIIFTLDENVELDKDFMPKLEIGCSDFIEDNTKIEKDIFFKNFTLQSLEDAGLVKGYKLYITSDKGVYMKSPEITTIKLTPELRYDGAVLDLADTECFWFEQDSSIFANSDNFLSIGGCGWKCLNQKIEEKNDKGETVKNFVSDKTFSYTVYDKDIIFNKVFKCIIIKDKVNYSEEIDISQLNNDFIFEIVANNKIYEKNAGNVILTASTNLIPKYSEKLSFKWIRQDKNRKYLDNDFYEVTKTVKNQQEIISFPVKKVQEVNYITCTLQSSVRGNIASKTLTVTTANNLGYKIVIENGDISYKYDANGKSPFLGAGYVSGSATAQAISPLIFKIYKNDGKEFDTEDYLDCKIKWMVPKNKTLLKSKGEPEEENDDYYIFTGMSLEYDIANYYNNAYTNNKILLTVTFGENTLQAVVQPNFIMDGAMGTNGTKINTIIRYKDYAYNETDDYGQYHRCKLIYSNQEIGEKIWDEEGRSLTENELLFTLDVYIEGEKVSENGDWVDGTPPEETATKCKWSIISADGLTNGSIDNTNNNNLNTIYSPDISFLTENAGCVILKAEIQYAGKTVVTYYPIDVIYDNIGVFLSDLLEFDIEGGFDCVLYNNAGYSPVYDKTPFVFKGPKIYKDEQFFRECICPHVYTETKKEVQTFYDKEFTLKVAESFNSLDINNYSFADSYLMISYYDAELDKSLYYCKPILVMCNTYSLSSLNNWDGLEIKINDNESIYSPMLGAGKKESDNTFSGFLMGNVTEAGLPTGTRLTAYQKGKRTFNIDAKTGKVTIGSHECGGQIEIDPNSKGAIIKSSNYDISLGTGMEINFSEPYIKFGSGKFKVDNQGKATMSGADVQGKITSEEGKIANFNIIKNYLYTGSSNADTSSGAVCLASNNFTRTIHNTSRSNLRFAIGSKFAVGSDGTVYAGNLVATGGSFKGDITGASGTFSGNLSGSTITGATIKNSSGTFTVDANGNIKGANISGSTITGSSFTGANNKFKVDADGTVTCSDISITGGTITLGGLELSSSGMTSKSTTQFGPFKCDINSIFANASGSGHGWGGTNTPTVFMCTGSSGKQTIAGENKSGWCFGAGHRFGVDIDGNVYCSAIKIKGESTSSATSTIGKMSVFSDYLLISLGQASDGNTYTMSLGPHTFNGINYLFSITSTGFSGPQTHMAITAGGSKIGF